MVACMRSGSKFVLDCDKWVPDFNEKYTSDDIFPASQVFDKAEFSKPEVHMKLVRDDENKDLQGA